MSHTKAAIKALKPEGVTEERWQQKVQRTFLGLVFVTGAVAGAVAASWPWYVVIPLGVTGATIWSTEMVTGALKVIVATFKDIWGTVKGTPRE